MKLMRLLSTQLIFILTLSCPSHGMASVDKVKVSEIRADGRVLLKATNSDLNMPWHLNLDFDDLTNFKAGMKLPVQLVVPAGKTLELGSLEVADRSQVSRYSYTLSSRPGDPDASPDRDFHYLLPWEHGVKHRIIQGYLGTLTHQDIHALDFDLEEGSRIGAAREGVVVKVKQDSNLGGPGSQFAADGNHVQILHSDGTWATYGHLQQDGAKVREGQTVSAGQLIGLSGHTGQASGPHLHFQVDRATWGDEQSLPVTFQTQHAVLEPREGMFVYGFVPGQAEFSETTAADIKESDLEGWSKPAARARELKIRTQQVDDKTFFFCANGTKISREAVLTFTKLANLNASQPLPFKKMVPAGREVYFLTLESGKPTIPTGYAFELSWR